MRKTSDKAKTLAGTARRDRRRPAPQGGSPPRMPRDLPQQLRPYWRQLTALLRDRLQPTDGAALRGFCEALWARQQAFSALQEGGVLTVDDRGQQRRSPAYMVWRQADASCRAFYAQFNMTPEARRLAGIADPAPAPSEFELFLQRGAQRRVAHDRGGT